MTNLVKDEEVDEDKQTKEVEPEDDDNGVTKPDDRDLLSHSLVVRRLLLAPKREGHPQRQYFKTRCTVNWKVCDVIIDSGSTENIVSQAMVLKLSLKTKKHPSLYSIG